MTTKTKSEQLTAQDLALYLGCECTYSRETAYKVFESGLGGTITLELIMGFVDGVYYNIKPILRPLSDMTEEEDKEHKELQSYWDKLGDQWDDTPESFLYLIRQGFDVFGWIEKGLAIKKEPDDRMTLTTDGNIGISGDEPY